MTLADFFFMCGRKKDSQDAIPRITDVPPLKHSTLEEMTIWLNKHRVSFDSFM